MRIVAENMAIVNFFSRPVYSDRALQQEMGKTAALNLNGHSNVGYFDNGAQIQHCYGRSKSLHQLLSKQILIAVIQMYLDPLFLQG